MRPMGLTPVDYGDQEIFITVVLLTNAWNHFNRLALAKFGDNATAHFNLVAPFNTLRNVYDARTLATNSVYLGGTPSIAT